MFFADSDPAIFRNADPDPEPGPAKTFQKSQNKFIFTDFFYSKLTFVLFSTKNQGRN